jgi:hypothetical protein
VVNLLGVVVPMVGWKHAPLSAFTSQLYFFDKYLHTLCVEMEMVIECIKILDPNLVLVSLIFQPMLIARTLFHINI